MIDFILAALLYLAIMFVVFFCISFLTIGMAYATARFFRQFAQLARPTRVALK